MNFAQRSALDRHRACAVPPGGPCAARARRACSAGMLRMGRGAAAPCILKAHDDLPAEVRPKEVPRHLRSSPPAFRETWATKRGVEPSELGRYKPAVRSMKRNLPRRNSPLPHEREATGSRVLRVTTKAMEGVKSLERQPRRTQRRRGRGTLAQPSWEQERPVSAPAVRRSGCHPLCGLGASSPISRGTAKWVRAERESERRTVLLMSWQQNHGGGKAQYLVCASEAGKRW